jgi:4-amino-4-deoxy-L-arabinose transferase-like glycosyltransferase
MFEPAKALSLNKIAFYLSALFFLVNLLFLTGFPFMHSDEPWLSGLSRHIAASGNFGATEPFFDLKPRHPHAIRIVFHGIQAVFIKILGYHWWTVRLISLIWAAAALFFFYKLSLVLLKKTAAAVWATLLLGVDLQFIYAAHLARPEIMLCSLFIISGYTFLKSPERHSYRRDLLLAGITGIGIGIHPNSFILAVFMVLFYLYAIVGARRLKWLNLARFSGVTGCFALGFIGLSLCFDPHFLSNYAAYGQTQFQVLNPLSAKWLAFQAFYINLFNRNTGTYYGTDIRLQLVIFPIILLLLFAPMLHIHFSRKSSFSALIYPILGIFAINLGILLIGRFNPTSVVFQFPFCYILLAGFLDSLPPPGRWTASIFLLCALGFVTVANILPLPGFGYAAYLQKIGRYVPRNQRVLTSLNTEYYFDSGKLSDFRNLPYLRHSGLSFTAYIRRNRIRYIVFPESIDGFFRQRPRWDFLYGNLAGCYREMKRFLNDECREIGSFTDRIYGMEIPGYPSEKAGKIVVYQVGERAPTVITAPTGNKSAGAAR